jgi:hypothetical protein
VSTCNKRRDTASFIDLYLAETWNPVAHSATMTSPVALTPSHFLAAPTQPGGAPHQFAELLNVGAAPQLATIATSVIDQQQQLQQQQLQQQHSHHHQQQQPTQASPQTTLQVCDDISMCDTYSACSKDIEVTGHCWRKRETLGSLIQNTTP